MICSQIFLITNRLFDLVQKLDRQKRMYLVNPKIQRSKKNISAWSRNYLAKAERFYFTQKPKDQSKSFQLGLEIILVKAESRIYLSQSRTVPIGLERFLKFHTTSF